MARDESAAVHCFVYRSAKKNETYLYLRARDAFDELPAALRAAVGRLELAMELDLHPGRPLARADVRQVMAALAEQGFYLQLPPPPGADAARG